MAKTGDATLDLIYGHNEKIDKLQKQIGELQENITELHGRIDRVNEDRERLSSAIAVFIGEKFPGELDGYGGWPLRVEQWLQNKQALEEARRREQWTVAELRAKGYTITGPQEKPSYCGGSVTPTDVLGTNDGVV